MCSYSSQLHQYHGYMDITIVSNLNLKVCSQKEASFGKSQLLIALTLANQNKHKKGANFDFYCLKLRTVLYSGTIV